MNKEIIGKLGVISKSIYNEKDKLVQLGLLSGKTGLAVFFFEYAQITRNSRHSDVASNLLSDVLDNIGSLTSLTFSDGICGILWTTQRYINAGVLNEDGDILLKKFDDFLTGYAIQELTRGRYDYMHQALGVMLYLIERYGGTSDKSIIKNSIFSILEQLEKCAVYEKSYVKWIDNFSRKTDFDSASCNYGLAHGLPSIISILVILLESGIVDDGMRIRKLIDSACAFIVSKKRDVMFSKSFFANTSIDESENSRLAWCYGDLGVGLSLLRAGVALKNSELIDVGNEIGKYSLFRTQPEDTRVTDACLCHGAAGISMIFRYYFYITQNRKYLIQSMFWLRHSLLMSRQEEGGIAGYRFWNGDSMKSDMSLLVGVTGVGLNMMSALREKTGWWERSLLF